MRSGSNVKFTHLEEELVNEMLSMREFRHLKREDVLEFSSRYGRWVTDSVYDVDTGAYHYESAWYHDPKHCVEYLSSMHKASCVVCGTKHRDNYSRQHWPGEFEFSSSFLGTGVNYRDAPRRNVPGPLCRDCLWSAHKFLTRRGFLEWKKSWDEMPCWGFSQSFKWDQNMNLYKLKQRELELFWLEWLQNLFERGIKKAKQTIRN